MFNEDLIKHRVGELEAQYEQAKKQLAGLEKMIIDLRKYASHLVNTGDFTKKPMRMSNEAWKNRATEAIEELMRADRKTYPTFSSVLTCIYVRLRNVYGVVLEQLRKDYKYKYDILCLPTPLDAISDDDTVRGIFDSILIGLFPEHYFDDQLLTEINSDDETAHVQDQSEKRILKIMVPLAIKRQDHSFGYSDTFDFVCDNMDCSWGNLQTRYMHKNNSEVPPSKLSIIISNVSVLRKFKKAVRVLLDNDYNL